MAMRCRLCKTTMKHGQPTIMFHDPFKVYGLELVHEACADCEKHGYKEARKKWNFVKYKIKKEWKSKE